MKTRKSPNKYGYRCRLCSEHSPNWLKMKLHLETSHWDQIKAFKKMGVKDPIHNATTAVRQKLVGYYRMASITPKTKRRAQKNNKQTHIATTEAINQIIQLPVQIHINLAEALASGCAWFGPPQENEA